MARLRRFLPAVLVVLLAATAAVALREVFRSGPASPPDVPDGDYEIAYIHTTTSPQTWERLVAAMFQIPRKYAGLQVDDSRAFLHQTAAVPEVVLVVPGHKDKIRIRWYKLSSEVGNREWVQALARRDPAPLVFMGGGSSDRAIELAQALNEQVTWKGGTRPLLFITTATANTVVDPDTGRLERLIQLYPGRTFRGCFTNQAMAEAVVDFVRQPEHDLKPTGNPRQAYILAWQDDPYSIDLADQFDAHLRQGDAPGGRLRTVLDKIDYSVGTFTDPNPPEQAVMDRILPELASHPDDRSLLVLPAVTIPARRMLRAFAADSPLIGKRLVAVTGDGVSFNTLFRDADVAWPIQELPIPLVFFAHQNPVLWPKEDDPPDPAALHPPTATDDVLLFRDMIDVIARAIYIGDKVPHADKLLAKLRAAPPSEAFFTPEGERVSGRGEYVVVVRPQFEDGRIRPQAVYDVHTRQKGGKWSLERRLVK